MNDAYDIFISFKKTYDDKLTEDYYIASSLYKTLTETGYKVFFSEEEINNKNSSNFSLIIDEALNQSTVLIYVCTQASYLESPYVKYEWSSFSNELKSGHKKGHILGMVKGIHPSLLPYGLRSYELFHVDGDYSKLLTHLSHLIGNKVTAAPVDLKEFRAELLKKFSFRDQKTFERESLRHFFEFSLENRTVLAVISYEKYVDTSVLIYNLTKSYIDNPYTIYYIGDIQVFNFNTILTKEVKNEIIVIDKLYTQDHVNNVKELLRLGYRVICALPAEYRDMLYELEQIDGVTVFHLEELNDEETSKYVRIVAKEIGLPLSGNIETLLVNPTLKELRTPFMIRLILTSIKNELGYTDQDYNIIDIFEIIENFLTRQNSRINETIEYLFGIVLRKKINKFSILEAKNYEDEIEYLHNQGIISKTNTGFTITNQEYYLYRVALSIMNEHGLDVSLSTFRLFEGAIPYFVYLVYLETEIFDDTLLESASDELKEKMISLFISEKLPFETIITNKKYHKNIDHLLSRFRDSGLYSAARYIIQTCENLSVESSETLDYISEKIMLHYSETGEVLNVRTDTFKSIYYIGYVYYCIDEPNKALENYQRAYEIMKSTHQYNAAFMFDYIDTLLDIGDDEKVKQLIKEAVTYCDNKKDDFVIHYNFTLGLMAVNDLSFGLAETYYKISLSTALKVFNLKRIQISYGELGRLYIYQARYDEALDYLTRNLEIAKSISDFNGMAIASKMIALINLLQSKYHDAYRYFGYSENYAYQIKNYWRLYKVRLFLDLMDVKRANLYDKDIEDTLNMKSNVFLSTSLPLVALLYLKQGDKDKANEMIKKAEECAILTSNKRYLEVIRIIQSVISDTKKCYKSSTLLYQNDVVSAVKKLLSNELYDFSLPLPNSRHRSLDGARIELRQMDVKYAEDIFEYSSSKTSTKYVMWERHKDIKDTLSFIEYVYDMKNAGYSLTWAIYHKYDKKVIGTIDLNYRDYYHNAEVGYILNSKYWHQGYASEALQLIISYAREYLPIDKIYGVAMSENTASHKVLLKNGFILSEHIENYHDMEGVSDKGGDLYILYLNNLG